MPTVERRKMQIESIKNRILFLGGKAKITREKKEGINGEYVKTELEGTLGNYDIEFTGEECRFFTARKISDRGHFDAGSDYNPSGYIFFYKLKNLDELV